MTNEFTGFFEGHRNSGGILTFVPIELPALSPTPLPVPWLSQLGRDADFAPGDCGPACLAMWLRYLDEVVSVNEVSSHTKLAEGFRYTMPAHLIWSARHFGADLYWRRYLSPEDIMNEIDNEQPVIVLVHYPFLPIRYDYNYKYGHWLLITGYDDDGFYYHDPYFGDSVGSHIFICSEDFLRAWNGNHLDGNSDRQALRLRR